MLFTTPEQLIVLAITLIGGLLLGYACAPSPKKWKRRVQEQSDSFTAYYGDVEDKLRAANQRIVELKAQADAARADHAQAERTIAELRAAAVTVEQAPPPVVAVPALVEAAPEPEHQPETVEAVPEPAILEPVTETAHISPEPIEEVAVAAPTEASATAGETPPVVADAAAPGEAVAALPAEAAPPAQAVIALPGPVPAESAPIGPAEPEMPAKGWFASSARDDLTKIRGIDSVLDTRLFGLGVTRFEDIEKMSAEDEMALEERLNLPVGYVGREQWRTQAALLRAGKHDEHAAHFGAVETVA
jgi:predicted flap endonuclease-1-like 5' DNA nuclease